MPRFKHYTPPLSRFLVAVLYHQAKHEDVPMTHLANGIIETALKDKEGWKEAELQFREQPPAYRTR